VSLKIYKAPDHTACPDINIYDEGEKTNSLFDANLFSTEICGKSIAFRYTMKYIIAKINKLRVFGVFN